MSDIGQCAEPLGYSRVCASTQNNQPWLQVAAASAAAAASAPAAALHTAAEHMKQEVAVVRALALRGVNAESTLDACEAALLRGLHSIKRLVSSPYVAGLLILLLF